MIRLTRDNAGMVGLSHGLLGILAAAGGGARAALPLAPQLRVMGYSLAGERPPSVTGSVTKR